MSDAVLTPDPELGIYQVAALKPVWLDAYARGCRSVDLSQVVEIDGAGVQLLLSLWRYAQNAGDPIEFLDASSPVREAFSLVGATPLLGSNEERGHA